MHQFCVLIPAFNPDRELVGLVKSLKALGVEDLVIVDDGSSASCRPVFEELARDWDCVVLHHAINLGKGRALKTGLNECFLRFPKSIGVVTADADGQHAAEDVFRVGEVLSENREEVVLGCRSFPAGVPLRNRFGNELTKLVFASLTGSRISDTQTGLRGIPRSRVPELLRITGERYEYEINMLLATRTGGIPLLEVPIKTIYIENNRQSHFNPLLDSMRIYFQLLRFGFSLVVTTLVDFAVFWVVLVESGGNIALAMVVARTVASAGNVFLCRNLVFHSRSKLITTLAKYSLLVTLFGTVSYFAIQAVRQNFGIPTLPAKAIVEVLIFLASFAVQRDFIFYPTTKASSEKTD